MYYETLTNEDIERLIEQDLQKRVEAVRTAPDVIIESMGGIENFEDRIRALSEKEYPALRDALNSPPARRLYEELKSWTPDFEDYLAEAEDEKERQDYEHVLSIFNRLTTLLVTGKNDEAFALFKTLPKEESFCWGLSLPDSLNFETLYWCDLREKEGLPT